MAFPLHPGTPEEGKTLEELFKDRDVDIDQVMAHLKQVASGLGLPFGDRKRTYNSRLAQELGKWAESIIEVAESINLNGKDAHKVIQGRTYKEAVDSDWKRSYELKVNAVPTFLFHHQVLIGAQIYESLENLMISNNVKRRTLNS